MLNPIKGHKRSGRRSLGLRRGLLNLIFSSDAPTRMTTKIIQQRSTLFGGPTSQTAVSALLLMWERNNMVVYFEGFWSLCSTSLFDGAGINVIE